MPTSHRQFERVPDDLNVSLLQNALVVVIGIGMVGSQIAEGLARITVGRLRLIDHDVYEMENTLRHALPVQYANDRWNKAQGMADYLTGEVEGLHAEAIPKKIDESVSASLFATWLDNADLVVAATDDRNAQRRIGRQALLSQIPAIFPALYPRRGGGEVIVQLDYKWPCFGCWDYFRPDAEQLRGVRALDLDAQPVIRMAKELCLGLLDLGSGRRDLLLGDHPGDAPHQLVMLDRAGTPRFGALTERRECPSCSVEPSQQWLEAREAWRAARRAHAEAMSETRPSDQRLTITPSAHPHTTGSRSVSASLEKPGQLILALIFTAAPFGVMYFVLPAMNAHPNIILDLISLGCAGWFFAGVLAVYRALGSPFSD